MGQIKYPPLPGETCCNSASCLDDSVLLIFFGRRCLFQLWPDFQGWQNKPVSKYAVAVWISFSADFLPLLKPAFKPNFKAANEGINQNSQIYMYIFFPIDRIHRTWPFWKLPHVTINNCFKSKIAGKEDIYSHNWFSPGFQELFFLRIQIIQVSFEVKSISHSKIINGEKLDLKL